jgi:hypothetical protein
VFTRTPAGLNPAAQVQVQVQARVSAATAAFVAL